MGEDKQDNSLRWLLVISAVVSIASAIGMYFLVRTAEPKAISSALASVAEVGGIISGLSLSGTAVLTLNGRFTVRLLARYGRAIRFILFGGFSILVSISLLSAVSVLWEGTAFPLYVLSAGVPTMFVVLLATALLINGAFSNEQGKGDEKKPVRI
ncbi:hypothetical protein PQI23_13150 [Leucobacter sp. USCH14]|uniref:hypothetical protein n=1 Tax=Leucobacter sp. USCH14 TaxID=3024838 RepID=UPI0030AB31C5